jgi:hypothetical protein
MLLISIKIWLFEMGFEHILLKELMYLSSFGLFSYLSISTKRAMSRWLIDGYEKGGLSDSLPGVFHTSRFFYFFMVSRTILPCLSRGKEIL